MADKPRWVIKELVSVGYPEGDLLGMFFGYYSLLVYQIAPIYVTLFLRNRDLLTFHFCLAHLLSEIMTSVLKHFLKHPRPQNSALTGGLLEGKYGMPSQHCHCFAFIYFSTMWLMFHYYGRSISKMKKFLVLFIMTIALSIQVAGRIYLNFHTSNQCFCGVLFGAISASFFYFIAIKFILPKSDYICNIIFLRILGFRRDLCSQSPSVDNDGHGKFKLN